MESQNLDTWVAPHASWFMTSTESYIDGHLLTEIVRKGYNNSFQITIKLWETSNHYTDEELEVVSKLDFKKHRNRNDIIFYAQSLPEYSSVGLGPTPIVITKRDMDNEIVGYLSLQDTIELINYMDSVTSYNAARVLFSFVFGISCDKHADFWYGNPVTKLSTREYKEMVEEEKVFASKGELSSAHMNLERDW